MAWAWGIEANSATGYESLAMRTAYFQSIGGASGDMLLGALLDVGLPFQQLQESLRPLPLPEYSLSTQQVQRGHLTATLLDVHIPGERLSLSPQELLNCVSGGNLSDRVRERSLMVLNTLLEAERRVHRAAEGDMHLHELGSADTLIDIVGTVAGLEYLGVETRSILTLGRGPSSTGPPAEVPRPGSGHTGTGSHGWRARGNSRERVSRNDHAHRSSSPHRFG